MTICAVQLHSPSHLSFNSTTAASDVQTLCSPFPTHRLALYGFMFACSPTARRGCPSVPCRRVLAFAQLFLLVSTVFLYVCSRTARRACPSTSPPSASRPSPCRYRSIHTRTVYVQPALLTGGNLAVLQRHHHRLLAHLHATPTEASRMPCIGALLVLHLWHCQDVCERQTCGM